MIFSDITKLQQLVAIEKGWHVAPVGGDVGLFSPDNALVGQVYVETDLVWIAGLGSPSGIPQWGKDLGVTWNLVAGVKTEIESFPSPHHPTDMCRVKVGLSRYHNHIDLARVLAQAWLEHRAMERLHNADHADA